MSEHKEKIAVTNSEDFQIARHGDELFVITLLDPNVYHNDVLVLKSVDELSELAGLMVDVLVDARGLDFSVNEVQS